MPDQPGTRTVQPDYVHEVRVKRIRTVPSERFYAICTCGESHESDILRGNPFADDQSSIADWIATHI